MQRKYTKELLDQVSQECTSMQQVLNKLGVKPRSGTGCHIYKLFNKFNIDRSHFIDRRKSDHKSYPIEDYLSGKRYMNSSNLRKRLIKEGIKEEKCEKCGIKDWHGQYLSFELHHIDENRENNELSNLLIVCPNCHYCVHNPEKRVYVKKGRNPNQRRGRKRKCERPPLDILLSQIEELGYCGTGRLYSVSDNAIRKWIKNYPTK